ncbi:MAG: hypothetical protein V2I57_03670 [Xanthomonadales bacterium]|jgi:hypothetical protein|nr:hypothetical protein [Xanthomonadales bacterium]
MNDLERIEQRYDRRIWFMLAGLVIGITAMSVDEVFRILDADLEKWLDLALSICSLAGWLIVAGVLIALSRSNDSEMLAAPVDDERVQENRWRAYQFAFNAVLASQLIFMVGGAALQKYASFNPSLSLTANLTIGIGLAAALFRFQQLNR